MLRINYLRLPRLKGHTRRFRKYTFFHQSRNPDIYNGIKNRCRVLEGDKLIATKESNATDKLIIGDTYIATSNSCETRSYKMYKNSKFGKRHIFDGYLKLKGKDGLYSIHNFR